MLDFCGEHGIPSDIELIRMQDINEAYERLLKADVKYRFVIDMAPLNQEAAEWMEQVSDAQYAAPAPN